MGKELVTFREKLQKLIEIFASRNYDWEKHYRTYCFDEKDLFKQCCFIGMPAKGDNFCQCGSIKAPDTPKALYRILYLLGPENIDFSNMYKSYLFTFGSIDKRFWVQVEFFKYELGFYFYAPKETVINNNCGIIAGWPGADNGWHTTDEDGKLFFEMVEKAVNYPISVYPGNNFVV